MAKIENRSDANRSLQESIAFSKTTPTSVCHLPLFRYHGFHVDLSSPLTSSTLRRALFRSVPVIRCCIQTLLSSPDNSSGPFHHSSELTRRTFRLPSTPQRPQACCISRLY